MLDACYLIFVPVQILAARLDASPDSACQSDADCQAGRYIPCWVLMEAATILLRCVHQASIQPGSQKLDWYLARQLEARRTTDRLLKGGRNSRREPKTVVVFQGWKACSTLIETPFWFISKASLTSGRLALLRRKPKSVVLRRGFRAV